MNFNILYTRNVSQYCQQFFILWHTCIIFAFCKIILSFYIPYFTNFLSHTTVYPLEKLNFNNFNFSLFIAPLKRLLSYQNLTIHCRIFLYHLFEEIHSSISARNLRSFRRCSSKNKIAVDDENRTHSALDVNCCLAVKSVHYDD